ncbi:MAG: GNAT family N-acetyltransferase, partial [Thermoactinomyces sp.]
MKIRPATIDDIQGIANVHVKSWQTTYKGIVSEDYLAQLSTEDSASRWGKFLQSGSSIFVAETPEKKIVGIISGGKNRSGFSEQTGEIYAIYLLQEVQRKRIGTRLVQRLAESLKKQGFTSLMVQVLKENPARRFYEKLGAT